MLLVAALFARIAHLPGAQFVEGALRPLFRSNFRRAQGSGFDIEVSDVFRGNDDLIGSVHVDSVTFCQKVRGNGETFAIVDPFLGSSAVATTLLKSGKVLVADKGDADISISGCEAGLDRDWVSANLTSPFLLFFYGNRSMNRILTCSSFTVLDFVFMALFLGLVFAILLLAKMLSFYRDLKRLDERAPLKAIELDIGEIGKLEIAEVETEDRSELDRSCFFESRDEWSSQRYTEQLAKMFDYSSIGVYVISDNKKTRVALVDRSDDGIGEKAAELVDVSDVEIGVLEKVTKSMIGNVHCDVLRMNPAKRIIALVVTYEKEEQNAHFSFLMMEMVNYICVRSLELSDYLSAISEASPIAFALFHHNMSTVVDMSDLSCDRLHVPQLLEKISNECEEFRGKLLALQEQHIEFQDFLWCEDGRWLAIQGNTNEDDCFLVWVEDVTGTQNNAVKFNEKLHDLDLLSKALGLIRFSIVDGKMQIPMELLKQLGYSEKHDLWEVLEECKWSKVVSDAKPVNRVMFRGSNGNEIPYTVCFISKGKGFVFSMKEMFELQSMVQSAESYMKWTAATGVYTFLCVLLGDDAATDGMIRARSYEDAITSVHPKSRHLVTKEILMNVRSTVKFMLKIKSFGLGRYCWADCYVMPWTKPGQVFLFALNVSASHKMQKQVQKTKEILDMVLDFSNLSFWTFNPDTKNPQILTEHEKGHIEIGWDTLKRNVATDFYTETEAAFRKSMEERCDIDIEVPVFMDRPHWLLIHGSFVDSCLTGVFLDTTALKDACICLEIEKANVQTAVNTKSMFLANISHEIRTPLNKICGLLEALQVSNLTKEQTELTDCVHSSLLELLELINDTIDLSRLENGSLKPKFGYFRVSEVLMPVLMAGAAKARKLHTKLRTLTSPGDPVAYIGDGYFFTRAFNNIMSNCIKFTKAGEILISKRVNENDELEMVFEDPGIGMPPEKVQMLLDEFEAGITIAAGESGGVGIGLSLAFEMIRMCHGRLKIESQLGRGTKVSVQYPTFEPAQYRYVPRREQNRSRKLVIYSKEETDTRLLKEYCEWYGFIYEVVEEQIKEPFTAEVYFIDTEDINDQEMIEKLIDAQKTVAVCSTLSFPKTESRVKFFVKPIRMNMLHTFFCDIHYGKNSNIEEFRKLNGGGVTNLSCSVIAVVDNKSTALTIEKMLDTLSCRSKSAYSAKEAIEAMRSEPFDVLVIDHIDATKIASTIREANGTLPIIAFSSESVLDTRGECKQSSINRIICKPVFSSVLSTHIQSCIQKPFFK